jgi:hypothetical protein
MPRQYRRARESEAGLDSIEMLQTKHVKYVKEFIPKMPYFLRASRAVTQDFVASRD